MLHKNKCCNDCSSFERSERVFQDKMDTWRNCGCAQRKCADAYEIDDDFYDMKHFECKNHETEEFDDESVRYGMSHAMAYVRNQKLNTRTVKSCDDALEAGTMFDELEKPFKGSGGVNDDTY